MWKCQFYLVGCITNLFDLLQRKKPNTKINESDIFSYPIAALRNGSSVVLKYRKNNKTINGKNYDRPLV